MSITYEELRDAVAGSGVGLRARTTLEPLGGPGDKVFPATYGVERGAETKYAVEKRRLGTETVDAVVLDSVASQANRFELALLDSHRASELSVPVVSVDFRDVQGLERFDRISSLEAPHRVFDAILRDSLHGDVLFRLSDIGQAVTEASVKSAAAMFRYSPTTLLFGGWDSTGPKGGRGNKYERAITSEIVGLGVAHGSKTASRIDPLGIERAAGPLYFAEDGTWTLDESEARRDKSGKAELYKGAGEGEAGRPSIANLGNITPSIDTRAGGVTVEQIVATTVISFAQLRRLRFPVDADGKLLDGERRRAAEVAARTALAALGLAAAVLAFEEGFDLRSRCVLVATSDLSFDLLRRGSADASTFTIDRAGVLELLASAVAAASDAGMPWHSDEVLLQPTDRLVELVRRSQVIAPEESSE
jgi:CRISPR-associated protein Csb1